MKKLRSFPFTKKLLCGPILATVLRPMSSVYAALLALLGVSVQASEATFNFTTDPAGVLQISGNNPQPWRESGGNSGGFLAITYPTANQVTAMVFPDIDDGETINAFKFEADLRVGNSTGTRAADGFSISIARENDPIFADLGNQEFFAGGIMEGGTTTGIAISFDTWSGNTYSDGGDIEGILVRVDDKTILRHAVPTRHGQCDDPTSLQTGPRDPQYWADGGDQFAPESWAGLCWQPLVVDLDLEGKLTVIWKGVTILDAFQTEFFPSAGRLVLAGRTGGANEHTHIDNIKLTTSADGNGRTALLNGGESSGPQQVKLTASDRGSLSDSDSLWSKQFGESVSISGDRLVAGSSSGGLVWTWDAQRAGLVYVYARDGANWIEEARLVASDRTVGDGFGKSVSISGDTFVVGADGANPDGLANAGTAYVYVREGTSWVEQAKLTASDKAEGDHFGWSVSISGDTVVVGADSADPDGLSSAGAAYVYVRSGTKWVEQAKLTASNKAPLGKFGTSVSVSGDAVIVGAPWAGSSGLERPGAAYVYVREGTSWVEQTKLIARDEWINAYFGESVSISGNTLVVGAGGAVDEAWGNTYGAAYVYERKDASWVEQAKLTASDKANRNFSALGSVNFGESVSVSGRRVVVGARTSDPDGLNQAGAAYVFARSGTSWFEQAKLTATDKSGSDHFGTSVSISGGTVIAGASGDKVDVERLSHERAGAAYVFTGFEGVGDESVTGSQSKIAFTSTEYDTTPAGNTQIYVMDFDGSNPQKVSSSPGNNTNPSWSPNGSKIAFVSDRDGNPEIYIMDANGANVVRLTNDSAEDRFPAFSPDGNRIAFASTRDGNIEIYAMDVNGSNLTRLTSEPEEDNMPMWSPDGSRIIFSYGLGDSGEIYSMDADGANRTQLTSNSAADLGPAYSPDGTKILFNTNRDGNNEVYVMDSDGSNQINLTNNPDNDGVSSRWTPDGAKVLFWSRRQGG